MSRHLGSAQAWRSAALIGIAWLATGCVLTEDQRIDQELAQGRFEVHADALTAPLKTPATFAYAPGSTVHLADNRFDSFEIEGLLRSALARRIDREAGGLVDDETRLVLIEHRQVGVYVSGRSLS